MIKSKRKLMGEIKVKKKEGEREVKKDGKF